MAERGCRSEDCEAHVFMVETMKELKHMHEKLTNSQEEIVRTAVKLTENVLEIHRTNEKLDKIVSELRAKDSSQDEDIAIQRSFTNRAIGAVGVISLSMPIIMYLLGHH